MNMITEIIDKGTQFLYLLFIWNFMRSVEKWNLSPKIFFCHCLISKKHKIFDDLRCTVSLIRFDINWFPLLIQFNLCLWKIKINRTSLAASFSENRWKFLHLLNHRNKILIFFQCFRFFCQHLRYTCITHTLVYPDHSLRDLMIDHFALWRHCHNTG